MNSWQKVKVLYWFDQVTTWFCWAVAIVCFGIALLKVLQTHYLASVGALLAGGIAVLVGRWHPKLIRIEDPK